MSITRQSNTAASIELARVLDVDIATYTLTVATMFRKAQFTNIAFATPYQHFNNGEGIYFMPEVGSICWLCTPSDHNKPFVLAWFPGTDDNQADYRANKLSLNPGDICLGTRDENFLVLRRGGVVQVGGGPLCQRMFIPASNLIQDFCENYALHSIGGDLEWTVERSEQTKDGHRPALLRVKAKEFADDPEPVGILEIGSHGDNDPTILALSIRGSGQSGAATKIALKLKKDGSVDWSVDSDFSWKVKGALSLEVDGDIDVSTKGSATLTADAVATLKGKSGAVIDGGTGTSEVKAGGEISLQAPRVAVGLGSSPGVKGDILLQYLLAHTHISAAAGSPTTPPVPLPIDFLMKKFFSE